MEALCGAWDLDKIEALVTGADHRRRSNEEGLLAALEQLPAPDLDRVAASSKRSDGRPRSVRRHFGAATPSGPRGWPGCSKPQWSCTSSTATPTARSAAETTACTASA